VLSKPKQKVEGGILGRRKEEGMVTPVKAGAKGETNEGARPALPTAADAAKAEGEFESWLPSSFRIKMKGETVEVMEDVVPPLIPPGGAAQMTQQIQVQEQQKGSKGGKGKKGRGKGSKGKGSKNADQKDWRQGGSGGDSSLYELFAVISMVRSEIDESGPYSPRSPRAGNRHHLLSCSRFPPFIFSL
jgi:hypothetical protein